MNDEVTLTAQIRECIPNAMRDEFEDGGFQSYDAVKLHIVAPPDLARDLTVYHAGTIAAESPWRHVGKKIAADVKPADLKSQVIFDGAFRNVRLLPD